MNNAETDAFGEKIDPEWFKWVIHRLDSSIRKLGADADIDRTEKTILRAVKSGTIRPELLDQIAKKLESTQTILQVATHGRSISTS